MADKNKLYITISDERGGGGTIPTPKPDASKEKKERDTLGRYIEHEMFHLVKSQATQSVNFALSNIGNFTGDYITQRKVNEAKQSASGIMTIGVSTIAGAKYGPWGAAIGFVVGAVSVISGGVFNVISNSVENAKENYNISQLRERAGLNSIYDGSRGTEN